MRTPLYAALPLYLATAAAAAADAAPPTLQLSAAATVKIAPDELVADLTALAQAPSAAAAQRRVNELMQKAESITHGKAGISIAFRDYAMNLIDEKSARWSAQQTVELRGADADAVLGLAAQLQQAGLALGDLGWQVSAERLEQARRQASVAALKKLKAEASEDAAALNLTVARFRTVEVGRPGFVPLFHERMAAPAAMAAMPPPKATREDQDVTVEVNAAVELGAPPPDGSPRRP